MRNLVPSRVGSRVISIVGAFLLSYSSVYAQSAASASADMSWPEPLPTLSLTAEQRSGARLEIITRAGVIGHASGTLTIEGQVWRTTDIECGAFRNAIEAFQLLPPLKPSPGLLLPDASPDNQLPPRRFHAVPWIIRTQLHAPDRTTVDVEMRGSQGPYAKWLDDTVQVIQACGRPVADG